MFLIKNHFSLLFLTPSFPLIYSSPFFFLVLLCTLPFSCIHFICLPIITYLLLSSFHSLHLLCPLGWSSVCLFSLSSSQHLPFVLLITSSALAFVVIRVFAYWHLPFFSFSTGHELFLQSCEPRTSDGLPLVSAGKFLRYSLGCRFCDLSQWPLPLQFGAFTICRWPFWFLKCPYRDMDLPWSVLSLSWAFSLSLCSPAHDQLWLEIFSFIVLPLSVLCLSWASGLSLCSQAHYQL